MTTAKTLREYIDKSVEWVISIRNDDGGWGIYEESASFVVSTAEALLALECAKVKSYKKPVQFLVDTLQGKYELQARYQRHYGWAGYALLKAGEDGANKGVSICVDWLMENQNRDGGWSHSPNSPSSVYPTFLVIRIFYEIIENDIQGLDQKEIREALNQAILWLVRAQNSDFGWGFEAGDLSNMAATAYGILALTDIFTSKKIQVPITRRTIDNSADFLYKNLADARNVTYEPNVASHFKYPFHHFTLAWCLLALIRNGYSIYDRRVWDEFVAFLELQSDTGGWSESPQIRPTVWATYNAILLLKSLEEAFNPVDHLLSMTREILSVQNEYEIIKKQVEDTQLDKAKEIDALNKQIIELETRQNQTQEEISRFVKLKFRVFELFLSRQLFYAFVITLLMLYIFFLSSAQSMLPLYKTVTFITIPVVGYLISHVIGKQILGWSTENTVQLGLGVVGMLITLHLAFVGLN